MSDTSKAVKALLNYQQTDEEGVMVLVSRQAIHEVVDDLAAAEAPQRVVVTNEMVEKATMVLLGHEAHGDMAPGVDWHLNRRWTINLVRELMHKALSACFEEVQDASLHSYDDWMNESEVYGIRAERFFADFRDFDNDARQELDKWMRAAFSVGASSATPQDAIAKAREEERERIYERVSATCFAAPNGTSAARSYNAGIRDALAAIRSQGEG